MNKNDSDIKKLKQRKIEIHNELAKICEKRELLYAELKNIENKILESIQNPI